MLNFLEAFFTQYGYLAVFLVLLACGFGVPIPEDITLLAGGVISGLGHTNIYVMLVVSMLGVLAGDGVIFFLGKIYGQRILKFRPVARIMTPKRYAQVQEKFDRYGNWVLFVARFLPGLRTPIFMTAGMSGVSVWRWLLMDGMAALISVPIWIAIGHFGASNRDWLLQKAHQFQTVVFILLGLGALIIGYLWWRKRQRTQFFRSKRKELRKMRKQQKQRKLK